ncbi:MAG: TonB-dependent receptor plug domain-containing protein [Nitrospinaceae bacterium]
MKNPFMTTGVLIFLMTGTTAYSANVEEETIELKPVKVKAARKATNRENIPSSLTIISEKEIKRKKFLQVEELLRGELGLDVARNGPLGGTTSVFMRGAGSSSTLVMVDGIQVNLNTTGGFNFAHLTTDNIERIEILRGPQSTLWGGDAVGGVINIITKKGKGKPVHSLSFEGGSFDTFKETATSSGAFQKFDYSISASRTDSGGFSSATENRGNPEEDGYENTTVSTRLGMGFLDDGRVEFVGRYTRAISQFDGFSFATGLPADGNNGSKIDTYFLAIPITKSFGGWWEVTLNPNFASDESFSFDPTFSNSHIINRTYTVDLQNNLKLHKYVSAVFGGEYQVQNGVNEENGLVRSIYTQGYFLQAVFNYLDRVVLTAGFRHDINSVFEDKTTKKFEAAYRFEKTGTRVRTAYATGFRAPTVNDLFFPPLFGFTTSNPNLKPEESKSWEVGIDQSLWNRRVRVGITYFDSNFTNLIQLDSAFIPQNIGKADSRGIESEIDLQLTEDLDVALRHTWNETFDQNDAPLRRRAKHKFTASVHHNWNKKLDTLVSVYVRGGIRDGKFNTDAFTTVRAVLSYQLTKNLKITARGENLLDENYEELPGFGTAGVSGYAGFTYYLDQ